MPPTFFGQNNRALRAFSLVELLSTVAVIGLIVAVVVPSIGSVRTSAARTKLTSDVGVLNRAVALYVAEGGSLDGVVSPLEVIERLKTKTSAADARRHVGPATGRLVDLRLTGASTTASGEPRAVWDSTLKKFVLASQGSGISSFYFDDAKGSASAKVETRKASSMLYNGSNGWVWANGGGGAASTFGAIAATTDGLLPSSGSPSGSPSGSSFGPSSSSSTLGSRDSLPPPSIAPASGTFEAIAFPATATITKNVPSNIGARALYMIIHSNNTYTPWMIYSAPFSLAYGDTVLAYNQSTDTVHYVDSVQVRQVYIREPKTLPVPLLTPPGGIFANTAFPVAVTILPNGAPGGSFSKLKYRITSSGGVAGAWTNYSLPVPMKMNETLEAKNFGVDTTSYYDSASASGTYTPKFTLVDAFTGSVLPKWTDMVGKQNLVQIISNLFANDVKASFGSALLGSPPNSLSFQRLAWSNVPPDSDFKIGTFSYYNGTVAANTEATSINLHLDVSLTKPGTYTGSANAHVSLWSSTNSSDSHASADYAQLDNPKTDFAIVVDGITYTLQLRFANIAVEEGWTDGTRLYVYEGYHGHADLIARFVSSY